MEFYVDGDMIVLKKYQPACIFCSDADDVFEFDGKMICRSCLKKMSETAQKATGQG